jgi:methylated-DNA-[protein]-cysteine S-methyltransferase
MTRPPVLPAALSRRKGAKAPHHRGRYGIDPMEALRFLHHPSPLGPLLVAGRGKTVHRIAFPCRTGMAMKPDPGWIGDPQGFTEARRQLDAYFAGTLTDFDLSLEFHGSDFEVAVWKALGAIPYGHTVSYGEIARRIGERPSAARAVGAAAGANPLPIVIACHRVIGADGSLTGFGGGLAAKRFLIDLERRIRPAPGTQLQLFG